MYCFIIVFLLFLSYGRCDDINSDESQKNVYQFDSANAEEIKSRLTQNLLEKLDRISDSDSLDYEPLSNDAEKHKLPSPQFSWGGLYPRDSPTRERKSLDGVWNFRLSPKDDCDKGFRESWFAAPLASTGAVIPMPVPSSYNDITQDKTIREHIGWAWLVATYVSFNLYS